MHSVDFQAIAATASRAMDLLATADVARIRDEGPSTLRALAENTLHARGIVDWMTDRQDHVSALATWRALRARVACGATR